MEAIANHREGTPGGSGEKRFKRIRQVAGFSLVAIKWIGNYVAATICGILLVLGAINLYDIAFFDTVPPVTAILGFHPAKHESPDVALCHDFDPDRAWEACQPALKILDTVCPEASKWARDRHACGKLVWVSEPDGTYAKYMFVGKILMINADMFALSNGERACTIAHEFRHSRQNFSKPLKAACVILLTWERRQEVVEDDAYFYESQVRNAIYGVGE